MFHRLKVIGGDLMSAASRTAVHGDGYLSFLQTEDLGGMFVEYPVDHIHLKEVIA